MIPLLKSDRTYQLSCKIKWKSVQLLFEECNPHIQQLKSMQSSIEGRFEMTTDIEENRLLCIQWLYSLKSIFNQAIPAYITDDGLLINIVVFQVMVLYSFPLTRNCSSSILPNLAYNSFQKLSPIPSSSFKTILKSLFHKMLFQIRNWFFSIGPFPQSFARDSGTRSVDRIQPKRKFNIRRR